MNHSNTKSHRAVCDCTVIHKDVVKNVKKQMPQVELLLDVAEFFRIFGDSTRIGILYALKNAELCVCDICTLLNMTQSAVSHQLRILKQARLVRYRRDGKIVYYKLDDEHISDILNLGMNHAAE
jgi:ArsR family transcriptional regulator, lead/cadmium/zinc/bismuth-responsive transcriptional repressor